MDFATAVSGEISVTLISVGDSVVTATACADDSTTVLAEVSRTHPGTSNGWSNEDPIILAGNGIGIARVSLVITSFVAIDGFGIDDVVFPSPGPEPSTMFLLGSGLVALVASRKRIPKL
jgi:hypothetical protein